MSTKSLNSIESLCPLDIVDLQGKETDFELYIDIAGKPVLYAQGHYEWTSGEVERLSHDGYNVLFYKRDLDNKVASLLSHVADQAMAQDQEENSSSAYTSDHARDLLKSFFDCLEQVSMDDDELDIIHKAVDEILSSICQHVSLRENLLALTVHDYYSFYHSMRTAAYGAAIAVRRGMHDTEDLHDFLLGCLAHDFGHLKVAKSILEKEERLNEREWFEIKQHPLHSLSLLEGVPISKVTREMVLHHHEREDGHGYPHGIKGNQLVPEVKILAFCDIFDALTSPRPYQKPISFADALEFIENNALEYLDHESFHSMKELLNLSEIKKPA